MLYLLSAYRFCIIYSHAKIILKYQICALTDAKLDMMQRQLLVVIPYEENILQDVRQPKQKDAVHIHQVVVVVLGEQLPDILDNLPNPGHVLNAILALPSTATTTATVDQPVVVVDQDLVQVGLHVLFERDILESQLGVRFGNDQNLVLVLEPFDRNQVLEQLQIPPTYQQVVRQMIREVFGFPQDHPFSEFILLGLQGQLRSGQILFVQRVAVRSSAHQQVDQLEAILLGEDCPVQGRVEEFVIATVYVNAAVQQSGHPGEIPTLNRFEEHRVATEKVAQDGPGEFGGWFMVEYGILRLRFLKLFLLNSFNSTGL